MDYPTSADMHTVIEAFQKYSGDFKSFVELQWKALPGTVNNFLASSEAYIEQLKEQITKYQGFNSAMRNQIADWVRQRWAAGDSRIIAQLTANIEANIKYIGEFNAKIGGLQDLIKAAQLFQGSASQYLQSIGFAIGVGGAGAASSGAGGAALYAGTVTFVKFLIIAGLIVGAGYLVKKGYDAWTSRQVATDVEWDKSFSPPQYILHIKGRSSTEGFIPEDFYALFNLPPDSQGSVLQPDGWGRTFSYKAELIGGPFSTPRQVCSAAKGLPLQDGHTWSIGWGNYVTSFPQKGCP